MNDEHQHTTAGIVHPAKGGTTTYRWTVSTN
jgi:hypothetical protein